MLRTDNNLLWNDASDSINPTITFRIRKRSVYAKLFTIALFYNSGQLYNVNIQKYKGLKFKMLYLLDTTDWYTGIKTENCENT